MFLSIIIPTLNCIDDLKNNLYNLVCQNQSKFEIIIVDGYSNDGTIEFLKKLRLSNLKIIQETPTGVYEAMNKGAQIANGDFIIFLGSDDVLIPNIIDYLCEKITNKKTIYYGNSLFPKANILYAGRFNKFKLFRKNICHQSIIYPTNLIQKNKFDTSYKILADYHFNLNFWKSKNYNWEYLPKTISIYNDYTGLSKEVKDIKFKEDRPRIILKSLGFFFYLLEKSKSFIKKYS